MDNTENLANTFKLTEEEMQNSKRLILLQNFALSVKELIEELEGKLKEID